MTRLTFGSAGRENCETVMAAVIAGILSASGSADGPFVGMQGSDVLRLDAAGSMISIGMSPQRRIFNAMAPQILLDSENTLVVTDHGRGLFDMTSGERSAVGPVFLVDWSALDTEEIFFARWNPLGREWLGPSRRHTRLHLEAMMTVIARHGGLSDVEQLALEDFAGILIEMAEHMDGDAGPLDFLPAHWRLMEASLPMLHDALGMMMMHLDKLLQASREKMARVRVRGFAASAEAGRTERLAALIRLDDASRAIVLARMTDALSFCVSDEAIRERLSGNSFAWHHLRGHPTAEAILREAYSVDVMTGKSARGGRPSYGGTDLRPMTVYLSSSDEGLTAHSIATDLFLQAAAFVGRQYAPRMPVRAGFVAGPHGMMLIVDADLHGRGVTEMSEVVSMPQKSAVGVALHAMRLDDLLRSHLNGLNLDGLLSGVAAVTVDLETPDGLAAARRIFRNFPESDLSALRRMARLVHLGGDVARRNGLMKPLLVETRPAWLIDECARAVRVERKGPLPAEPCAMRDMETPME